MKPDNLSKDEIAALLSQGASTDDVQLLNFPRLERASVASDEPISIDLLANVEVEVTVQLGRTEKAIREILGYGPGSVFELDRVAGEAVDILVNQRLVAKGEVVVIGENFGIRVTELVSLGGSMLR